MDNAEIKILLVEDEPVTAMLYLKHLEKAGYNVIQSFNGSDAVNTVYNERDIINLILMDIELGDGIDGTDAAEEILKQHDVPILFLSSHTEKEIVDRTEKIPSYGFVLKNSGISVLDAAVKTAIRLHNAHRESIAREERISEIRYKQLVDNAGEAILVAQNGMLKLINTATCDITGRAEDELYREPFISFIHPEDRNIVIENYKRRTTTNDAPQRYQFRILLKDGSVKWAEINAIAYSWNDAPATLNFLTNITERKEMEDALRESENKYRRIFENVQDVFYQTDINGIIVEVSPSIKRYSGFIREELIGKPISVAYFNPEDRIDLLKEIEKKGEVIDYELTLYDKFKNEVYTSTNSHFIFDSSGKKIGIEGSLRDITSRKHTEDALKKSLKQKEILMMELQHRVKNNLGIISSLLSLEMPKLSDEKARAVFMNARTRIYSMSGIYEQLYSSGNLDSVNLATYIRDLAGLIFKTYSISNERVRLIASVADVELDLRRTVPLGLILNELITNVLKYAYPSDMGGEIRIDLVKDEEQVTLSVSDDGTGLPEGFSIDTADSMGLSLVRMLVVQIGGKLKMESLKGTKVFISFSI